VMISRGSFAFLLMVVALLFVLGIVLWTSGGLQTQSLSSSIYCRARFSTLFKTAFVPEMALPRIDTDCPDWQYKLIQLADPKVKAEVRQQAFALAEEIARSAELGLRCRVYTNPPTAGKLLSELDEEEHLFVSEVDGEKVYFLSASELIKRGLLP